jgi:hypothetical protein
MKLDTIEEQQAKRMSRFLSAKDELLELALQLEHDLNYFGDYIGSEKLFEAKKHATAIYHIVKRVGETNE